MTKDFPDHVRRTERVSLLYHRRWTCNWGTGTTGLGTRGSDALRVGVSGCLVGRRREGRKRLPNGFF